MRTEFGLERTSCVCARCSVFCRFQPGALIPADLPRLIPQDADPGEWSVAHLLAMSDLKVVTVGEQTVAIASLVPNRSNDRSCHWFVDQRCQVHDLAPYGCAFFDQCQQSSIAAAQRWALAEAAIAEDWVRHGLYSQLWYHLWDRGLRETRSAHDDNALRNAIRQLDAS